MIHDRGNVDLCRRYMYLARVRKWDLFKNLKAHEKERFAEVELNYLQAAGERPSQCLHQRLVRRDKIQRHLRQKTKEMNGPGTRGWLLIIRTSPLLTLAAPTRHIKPAQNKALVAQRLRVLRPSLQIDNEDGVLRATKTYFDWYFDAFAQSSLTLDEICHKGLPINNMRIEIAGYQDPSQIMFDLAGGAYEIMCGFRERGRLRIHKGRAAAKLLIYRPSPFTLMDILSRFTDRMWISRMDLRSRIYSFIVSMAQSLLGREHIWAKVLSKLFSGETTDNTRMSTQRYIIDTLIQSHFNANPNYTTRVTEILGYEVIDGLVPEVRLQHFTKDLTVSLGQNHIATREAKFSLAARFYRAYQHKEAEAILLDALPFSHENATQFMDSTLVVTLTHLGYIYYAQEEYEKCISYARQAVQGWLAINKQSFHLLGSFEQLQRAFIRLERWEDLISVRQEYPDLHEKMPVALHAIEIPRKPSMMASPCNLLSNIEDQDAIGSNGFSQTTHGLASSVRF